MFFCLFLHGVPAGLAETIRQERANVKVNSS